MRRCLIMIGLFLAWGMALLVIKVRHNSLARLPDVGTKVAAKEAYLRILREHNEMDARFANEATRNWIRDNGYKMTEEGGLR